MDNNILSKEQLSEIYKWWDVFKHNSELVEIRVIEDKKTFSGYYTNINNLIRDVSAKMNSNVYFTINELHSSCHGRPQCELMQQNPKNTTNDAEITRRRFIFLDIDCKKIANVNSTDDEKKLALLKTREMFVYLKQQGFNEPIVVDSGNSYHLYLACDILPTEENDKIIKRFTMSMAMLFSDEKVDVDQKVFNLARIAKIPGSYSRKGSALSEDRPQRMCKILSVPDEVKETNIAYFKKIADLYPEDEVVPTKFNGYSSERFDLEAFIQKHNIPVIGKQVVADGTKYYLEHCLFNEQHKGKDAIIFQRNNGAISYFCYHNSCIGNDWKKVRLMYEPDAYDRKEYTNKPYYRKNDFNDDRKVDIVGESDEKGKKWLSMKDIQYVDVSKLPNIKTGYDMLDKYMIGLLMGDLTVLSGKSGAGKTSLTDCIILNAIESGHKCAVWSGELQDFRFQSWIMQIAAGKQNVKKVQNAENIYYCPQDKAKTIGDWMDGKLFLYNNKYGNNWQQLFSDIKDVVDSNGVELLILDNLTCLNIEDFGGDKNEKASRFVTEIKNYAKDKNIHIILVCHPRKETTFLRMDSIKGPTNLTDLCDNCLLIHRVGRDFVNCATEFLGKDVVEGFALYDAVIEITKNRSNGAKDKLVGLYYETESRRLKNDMAENINYGWNEQQYYQSSYPSQAIKPNTDFDTTDNEIEYEDSIGNPNNNYDLPY